MLTAYFEAAMRGARYEIMENGEFYGSIPKCRGTWANAKTLERCRDRLRSVLGDWVLLGLRFGDRLPVVSGINLNPPRSQKKAIKKAHA